MKLHPSSSRPADKNLSDHYREYLDSEAWRGTRMAALKRAGHRCAVCGTNRGLEVHHKHYRSLGAEAWGDLAVLCRDCHENADRRRGFGGRAWSL